MGFIVWWTPARIDLTRTLAEEGRTAAEIARRLSTRTYRVSPGAVRCMARRHGIPLWRCRGDSRKRVC